MQVLARFVGGMIEELPLMVCLYLLFILTQATAAIKNETSVGTCGSQKCDRIHPKMIQTLCYVVEQCGGASFLQ